MADQFKALQINADRICEAISKIGYNPTSAIQDIIDNSIVAGAKNIKIQLFIKEGMTLHKPKNLERIRIVDDGIGMNGEQIEVALQLGSEVDYEPNSLSKYGLGLKSAGFSLGRRIEVVSKKDDAISSMYYLDRDIIKKENIFGVAIDNAPDYANTKLEKINSGTIVSIDNIVYTSKASAGKIMNDIINKAGVSYCDYIIKNDLKIYIQILKGKSEGDNIEKEVLIEPKDILFWKEAYDSFAKESYDCKKPCKALDEEFDNPLNPEGSKIRIQIALFPKDKMKHCVSFSADEQKSIDKYGVGLKNSGFFFYRNGRLIKWGEKIFLNRQYGFRAKISFLTEHDELFDVDVSKQHLTISEDVEAILKHLSRLPLDQSKEIFKLCDELLKASKDTGNEGSEFNTKNATLEEEDEQTPDVDEQVAKERKEKIEEDSEQKKGDEPDYEDEEEEIFKRVRYWSNGKNLWESGSDRLQGTYVLIDKLHPYYDLVLSNLDKSSPERQSLEAFFHALAVGEIETIKKFQEVEYEVVKKALAKFIRTTSHQLDNWVNSNQDLFEDEN